VEDLDGEVLPRLTQDRLLLLLDDLACAVVRIDDVVADLVDDQLDLSSDLDVVQDLFGFNVSGQDVLL
jgi:hypothetical protein